VVTETVILQNFTYNPHLDDSVTQRHIPADLNPQQHLNSCKLRLYHANCPRRNHWNLVLFDVLEALFKSSGDGPMGTVYVFFRLNKWNLFDLTNIL